MATSAWPAHEKLAQLRGLRPTRQRRVLAQLMFMRAGDRHVTAEALHAEALAAGIQRFAGDRLQYAEPVHRRKLLREVAIEGAQNLFRHQYSRTFHFYIEREGPSWTSKIRDVTVVGLPEAPHGIEISRVDVIVRLAPAGPE